MPTRRELLLEQLVELFLQDGFLDFGVGDIASRLRCSKATLYVIAPSKEQLIVTVVRAFFRTATERVEARLDALVDQGAEPVEILRGYLLAISSELSRAGSTFLADVTSFEPAREIYARNTRIAARRVEELVQLVPNRSTVPASFVGVVAEQVMAAIHLGAVEASTGLGHAQAFEALADFVVAGVAGQPSASTVVRGAL